MSPKEQCEELLNSILSQAAAFIEKYQEFYPIGEIINSDNEVRGTAVYDGNDIPEPTDVLQQLVEVHRLLATQNQILVSGIAWNAEVTSKGKVEDAIIVSLEHKDGYSVIVGRIYKIDASHKVEFGEIFALEGKHDVFS